MKLKLIGIIGNSTYMIRWALNVHICLDDKLVILQDIKLCLAKFDSKLGK